ncbi:3781_t:CDS:2, partial [Cetraspora pellucida]
FFTSFSIHIRTSTDKFWSCFDRALEDNKHTLNGKRHILSIIVDEFSYFELQHNLGVGKHTIAEAHKYAQNYDYEIVNMSSYKTDTATNQPIIYLQDNKTALWKRFSEEYPNGMKRASFMTYLKGS